jgi:hypothetical protein
MTRCEEMEKRHETAMEKYYSMEQWENAADAECVLVQRGRGRDLVTATAFFLTFRSKVVVFLAV